MKVIMISSDPQILVPGTEAAQRFNIYRQLADKVIPLVVAGRGNWGAFRSALKSGRQILKEEGAADFLISAQDPPERWLVAWRLAKKFRIPFQVQVHTDILSPFYRKESFKNKIRVYIARFILRRATGVRVVSERIKNSLVEHNIVAPEKIAVLPVYIETQNFLAVDSSPDVFFDFIFVMVSRLTREKNIDLALTAFKEVVVKYPQTRLRIVGEGSELEHLITLASELEIMQHVEFSGWKTTPFEMYGNAHCYLLTSNYEGYGRTVVEAMATGLPVVMTDVGIAGSIMKHEESGLVVPLGDKDGLVRAMITIRGDDSLRERLRTNARAQVALFPTEQQYWANYKNLWEICYSAWGTRKN
jgi:glycosyltransferase involved in cell wall biosynthesis